MTDGNRSSSRKRSKRQPTAADMITMDQSLFVASTEDPAASVLSQPQIFGPAPDVLAVRPETGASMSFSHMNGLLHDFGIQEPELKARLCAMFAFIFEQGIGGLFDSLSALLTHMGYAVQQRMAFDQDQYAMRTEINRLGESLRQVQAENAELRRVREIETAEVDAKKGELDELIRAQSMSADIFDQQFSGEVTRLADENSALREDVDAKQAAITRKDAAIKERDTIISRLNQRATDLDSQLFSIEQDNRLKLARVDEERHRAVSMLDTVRASVFFDGVSPVVCPVLLCTGHVASYRAVIDSWAAGPGRNNGEITRSLKCPVTGEQTCVSSKEEVEFALRVARAVGVETGLPLVFEYTRIPGGEWVEFGFYDQLALASKACKIYGSGVCGPADHVVTADGCDARFFVSGGQIAFRAHSLADDNVSVMQGRVRVALSGWNPFPCPFGT